MIHTQLSVCVPPPTHHLTQHGYTDQHQQVTLLFPTFAGLALNVIANTVAFGFAHYILISNDEGQCRDLISMSDGIVDSCAWQSAPLEDGEDPFWKASSERVNVELGSRHYFIWRFLQKGVRAMMALASTMGSQSLQVRWRVELLVRWWHLRRHVALSKMSASLQRWIAASVRERRCDTWFEMCSYRREIHVDARRRSGQKCIVWTIWSQMLSLTESI